MSRGVDLREPARRERGRDRHDPATRLLARCEPIEVIRDQSDQDDRERGLERRERDRNPDDNSREVLRDVGRFRAVAPDDLRHIYEGDGKALDRDLECLRKRGLVRTVTRQGAPGERYVTLTPEGAREARSCSNDGIEARVYSGFKKAKEVRHDAALYRAYHAEVRKLPRGSRVRRLTHDDELRRRVLRDLHALERERQGALDSDDYRAVAERHHVGAKPDGVEYPDLQLEIEHPDGTRTSLNIEIVTGHYRQDDIQAKLAAGFSCYLAPGDEARGSRGRPVELAEDLWSL